MVQTWTETLPAGSRIFASPYKLRRDLTVRALEWDGACAGVYITMTYNVPGEHDENGQPTVKTKHSGYTFPPALEEEDVGLDVARVLSHLWHSYDELTHQAKPTKEDKPRFKTLSGLLEAA